MSDYRPTLIVPGLNGSGAAHWQTWWERRDQGAIRVSQEDWAMPDLERWGERISDEIRCSYGPAWIVAHSFGCLASLHSAREMAGRIAGMFLVAPADPEKFGLCRLLEAAAEIPVLLVLSRTDPWFEIEKAQRWSTRLGGEFVDLGNAGHINAESGFGAWQEGFDLFRHFKRRVEAERFFGGP